MFHKFKVMFFNFPEICALTHMNNMANVEFQVSIAELGDGRQLGCRNVSQKSEST